MWNPFKKKDPLEEQRINYALAFDIVPKVLNAFETGKINNPRNIDKLSLIRRFTIF